MNLLPPQPATSIAAEAPTEAASDKLPASLRTLPTVLKAGPGRCARRDLRRRADDPDRSGRPGEGAGQVLPGPEPAVRPDPAQGRSQPQVFRADEGHQRLLQRLHRSQEAPQHRRFEGTRGWRGVSDDPRNREDVSIVPRGPSFFRGSELPRLLVLAGLTVAGWGVAWQLPAEAAAPDDRPPTVSWTTPGRSCPIARSSSRPSPIGRPWRSADNAAYRAAARPCPEHDASRTAA